MIWEVGGEIRRLPASIETPAGAICFSRWKLHLVSASKFRHFFCNKQVNVTEQITMLIYCRTKTLKRARGVK